MRRWRKVTGFTVTATRCCWCEPCRAKGEPWRNADGHGFCARKVGWYPASRLSCALGFNPTNFFGADRGRIGCKSEHDNPVFFLARSRGVQTMPHQVRRRLAKGNPLQFGLAGGEFENVIIQCQGRSYRSTMHHSPCEINFRVLNHTRLPVRHSCAIILPGCGGLVRQPCGREKTRGQDCPRS